MVRQKHFLWVTFFGLIYLSMVIWGFWEFNQVLKKPQSRRTMAQSFMPAAATRYGQRGGYIWEMQNRLMYIGYYKGKVDGHFGYKTLQGVKYFQSQFGMTVDGVMGTKTKRKLWLATKNWKPASRTEKAPAANLGWSQREIDMMARTVYGEARGEPYIGKVAVVGVILNRVASAQFPNTPSGVIFQPGAFTAVSDGQIWLSPDKESYRAVRDALNGWDPSDNAMYYFNPVTATSKWIWSRPQIKKIGKHIFCR